MSILASVTALIGLSTRLKLAKLHLITDVRREQRDFAEFVASAFDGGVDLIQVRDAEASQREMLDRLEIARAIALDRNKGVVVGKRVSCASHFQADYLHLGAADGESEAARKKLHDWAIIGRSVHSAKQLARACRDDQVGYLFVGPIFGPIFGDTVDDGIDFPGLDLVRTAARHVPVTKPKGRPWFAVGGVTMTTIDQVLEAGAVRVAVSAAITRADDPGAAAAELSARLAQVWRDDPDLQNYRLAAFGQLTPGAELPLQPTTSAPGGLAL